MPNDGKKSNPSKFLAKPPPKQRGKAPAPRPGKPFSWAEKDRAKAQVQAQTQAKARRIEQQQTSGLVPPMGPDIRQAFRTGSVPQRFESSPVKSTGPDKPGVPVKSTSGTKSNGWYIGLRVVLIVLSVLMALTYFGLINIMNRAEDDDHPKLFEDLKPLTQFIYGAYWVLIIIFFFCFAKERYMLCDKDPLKNVFMVLLFMVIAIVGGGYSLFKKTPSRFDGVGYILLGVAIFISFSGVERCL
jgi:hypothetical protein